MQDGPAVGRKCSRIRTGRRGGSNPPFWSLSSPCSHVAGPGPGGPMSPGPHPSRLSLASSGLKRYAALLAALAFSGSRRGNAVAASPPAYACGSFVAAPRRALAARRSAGRSPAGPPRPSRALRGFGGRPPLRRTRLAGVGGRSPPCPPLCRPGRRGATLRPLRVAPPAAACGVALRRPGRRGGAAPCPASPWPALALASPRLGASLRCAGSARRVGLGLRGFAVARPRSSRRGALRPGGRFAPSAPRRFGPLAALGGVNVIHPWWADIYSIHSLSRCNQGIFADLIYYFCLLICRPHTLTP